MRGRGHAVRGGHRLVQWNSGRPLDGEAVVVGGDLDLAGGAVQDRLVDPAVAVGELVGAEAQRAAEELVAEADAEVGQPPLQRTLQQGDLRGGGGRVAGSVGEEQPVGLDGQHVVEGRRRREHVALDPALGHHPRSVGLQAEVDHRDREEPLPDRGHDVALGGGHLRRQVGARHLAGLEHPGQQRLRVGLGRGDPDPHRASLAQAAGQGAGVDAGDADDALVAQRVVERAPRAPAGRAAGRVADDVARHPDPRGLRVLVVHARVADVRGGHHHHLAVVGRVGERLLVAGHPGREDGFAEGLTLGAVGLALEEGPVLQHEDRPHRCWGCCGGM